MAIRLHKRYRCRREDQTEVDVLVFYHDETNRSFAEFAGSPAAAVEFVSRKQFRDPRTRALLEVLREETVDPSKLPETPS